VCAVLGSSQVERLRDARKFVVMAISTFHLCSGP
jgi:hypothetical protein